MNFLYCFDKNYNKQAFASIISLLNNVDKEINIFILHNNKLEKSTFPDLILTHKNLKKLTTYQFEEKGFCFPNLKDSHVSAATYYRLFIEKYLDKDVEFIVYLDADTICLNNPLEYIYKVKDKLIDSDFVVAAKTELKISEIDNYYEYGIYAKEYPFERLEIKDKYFNAGIMLIDLHKWKKLNYTSNLINNLEKYKEQIVTWDQDVLNSFIDGAYVELDNNFNFFDKDINNSNYKNIFFLHYLGSHKPWSSSGLYKFSSKFYHKNYFLLYHSYHLIHVWKRMSVINLLKAIISLQIRHIDRKLIFFAQFIKSLLK